MSDRQALTVTDPGPLARFEDVKRDSAAPMEVFARLCEGQTLFQIAREWKLPKYRFADWFLAEHAEVFERAQIALGSEDMHEVKAIADGDGDVARDRLRTDTRFRRASKFDRARYGEKTEVRHSGLAPTLVIEIVGAAVLEKVLVQEEVTLLENPPGHVI